MRFPLALCLTLAIAAPASAQSSWTYRGRVAAESTSTQANGGSPLARASTNTWRTQQVFVASADGIWTSGDRLRIGAALSGVASGHGDFDGRVREIYARASVAPWMDVEAGKRIVRWGVGYGFSPAGVLDPPRVATDPSDRLQLNEGLLLARADLYYADSSLTVTAGEKLVAARLSTIAPGGLEIALIGAAGPDRSPQYAATITHVIGQRLEWHAETLVHEDAAERVISGTAGLQYTFTAGLNVVVEYHRNARGLNDEEWNDVLSGRRSPGARPGRENFLFLRAARAGADVRISPELIVIAGLDDNSWTLLPSVTWTPHRHVQAHVRVTRLAGPKRSVAGAAPFSTSMTAGASVRF